MPVRWVMLLLCACLLAGSGCALFQKQPSAVEVVDVPLTPEQQQWWEANKTKARYMAGRGWYVEGTSGYFDEEGRPMATKRAPDPRAIEDDAKDSPISQALSLDNNVKRFKKLIGKGPNEGIAKAAYKEGETLFRQRKYAEAAKKFRVAYDRWPDSPMEEEAIYLAGESHIFADKNPKADDDFALLIKKYPGTTHLDNVVARRFAVGRYWEGKASEQKRFALTPNLTDKTQPLFDTGGHALKCYERIRLDDPTGPLADDSLMASANYHFTRSHWEDADYFYSLLRTEYPKSEHQYQAHLLGLQAKLRRYQGPSYDIKPIDEADDVAQQLLAQFNSELGTERERILQVRTEIRAQRALREFNMAEWYYKGKHFTSAKIYYAEVIKDYPDTRLAQESKSKIDTCRDLPDAKPPFEWLVKVLPQSKKETPTINVAQTPSTAKSR